MYSPLTLLRGKLTHAHSSDTRAGLGKPLSIQHNHQAARQWLTVWVAVYKPEDGKYFHWAISICDEARNKWHTYEAIRTSPKGPFTTNYMQCDPQRSSQCLPLSFLSRISATCFDAVTQTIKDISIPKPQGDYNCQTYVIDVCSGLVRAGHVNATDFVATLEELQVYQGEQKRDFGEMGGEGKLKVISDEYVTDSASSEGSP